MRRFSRTAVTAAVAPGLLILGACGGEGKAASASGQKTFRISMSNIIESAPLFHSLHTNLDDVLSKASSDVKVKWYDNNGDPAKMLQNTQLMIRDKPDAIVIYPVSSATQGVSRLLEASGIPCISVNIPTDACHFLNLDSYRIGVENAKVVGKIAAERGWNASNTTVLIGQNAALGESVNSGMKSFYATIAPMLGMKEVDPKSITPSTTRIGVNAIQFDTQSTLQPAFENVKNLLPSVPADHNIILMTVNNDATQGALRALEDSGRGQNDKLLIAGVGGDETGIKKIRTDPRWVAEADIFISWWGSYAVAMAQEVAGGAKPPSDVTPTPQITLTKDTVDEFHAPPGTDVTKLPPLGPDGQFLEQSKFIQSIRKVAGL